jgi:hypothetical protein
MILAWLLHAFYSTISAFLLAHLTGGLTPWLAGFCLAFGTYFGWRHAKRFLPAHPDWQVKGFAAGPGGALEVALFTFMVYAAWRHFMWMLFTSEHHLATLSLNNYGDLALHINYIRAFANGISFPPQNPIFSAEALRYPYGVDLYNALWEAVGVRLQAHLFFTGVLATIASLIFLRSFGGWWAMGAFFLNGGANAWRIISEQRMIDTQQGIDWKNLFLSVFITQRGMLMALPAGLMLLISVRRHYQGDAILTKKQMTVLGVVWGFLPLFHLHALLIVSLLMLAIAIENQGRAGIKTFLLSKMALLAYIPATYLVLRSTGFFKAAGIAHLSWGWTLGNQDPIVYFFMNFGPWLLLPIAIFFGIYKSQGYFAPEKRKRLFIEFGCYTFFLLLFFNVMLAPWPWDNIKLLIWPYLGFARLAAVVLEPRLGGLYGHAGRLSVAAILLFAGFASVLWTLQIPSTRATPLFHIGDLAEAEGALLGLKNTQNISPEAVFAAATTHLHPLAYFGRMRTHGYGGHLWTHAIDSRDVKDKLDRIMSGDPNSIALARELGITHIYWGKDERLAYGEAPRPWMDILPNVSRVPGVAIYAVK